MRPLARVAVLLASLAPCACKAKLGDCQREPLETLAHQLTVVEPRERPDLVHAQLPEACELPDSMTRYLFKTCELGRYQLAGVEEGVPMMVYALHRWLLEPIVENAVDLVFCAGPAMHNLWQALPSGCRGGYAEDSGKLEPRVLDALRDGDSVMVKGSFGSRMSPIVKALQRRYSPALEEKPGQG